MRIFSVLRSSLLTLVFFPAVTIAASVPAAAPADRVYRNGVVFTADGQGTMAEALAVRGGRIVFVGSNQAVARYVGPATESVDLGGRFLMPGLVDGHMHPFEAGRKLLKFSLNYESLSVAELQQRVQAFLDQSAANEPDAWLEVVNWFQESMRPTGVITTRAVLDGLRTKRPIIIRSSFGHTVLANTRALAIAGITASTPDPIGGKIWRGAESAPTGLLEDGAFAVFYSLLPQPSAAEDVAAAAAALQAMNRQGITSFLDAHGSPEALEAFTALRATGKLTARAHFAPRIELKEAADPAAAVARVAALAKRFDGGAVTGAPGVTVRHAKLFLDGVISAPAFTGAMVEPYLANIGSAENPRWVPGTNRGPDVYFPAPALAAIVTGLGRAGLDAHMHADGDGAVRAGLDAVAALRKALPGVDIRPAIAHAEIVAPADFSRFKQLGVIPVLSFQWEKPAGDTVGLKDFFGPERMKILEPAGLLAAAGARIAFGSDWPVDLLDEWLAFQVGVTRENAGDGPAELRGRLGDDPGLSREAVLRAATINAAYSLHLDDVSGSLEVGKFADLIVLDRNPLTIAAGEIGKVRVLQTVVGGTVVYEVK